MNYKFKIVTAQIFKALSIFVLFKYRTLAYNGMGLHSQHSGAKQTVLSNKLINTVLSNKLINTLPI